MELTLVKNSTAVKAWYRGFEAETPDACIMHENDDAITYRRTDEFSWANCTDGEFPIANPSQELLAKWLREKHGMHIEVQLTNHSEWMFVIRHTITADSVNTQANFPSYEKALETALKLALTYLPIVKS